MSGDTSPRLNPDPVTIDFAIVGAAKSATTSLHFYLGQHPRIFLPQAKELAFFLADPGDPTELALVKRFYANVRPGQLVGLTEVHMLMRSHVAERIRHHNPEARVIAILRNPIERAYSGYWFNRLRGWDSSPSFEHAIERELKGDLTTDSERLTQIYLEHGQYADQLDHYRHVLGLDRVAILLTEDLRDHPIATLSGLLHWLEVEGDDDGGVNAIGDIRTDVRHNITSRSRFHRLEGHLKRLTGPLRTVARAMVTDRHRRRIRRSLLLPLRKWTHVPFTPPPIDPSTTFFLRVHYHVQIERLGEMLGRDLRHWLDPTSSAASRFGP